VPSAASLHLSGVPPMQMFACCYPSFAVVTVYYIWHTFFQSPPSEHSFGNWLAHRLTAERTIERHVCSHCRSPHTGYAGTVGARHVWRCSDCSRTFWHTKQRRNIFGTIGALLVGGGD
jgi:hypothetical protein